MSRRRLGLLRDPVPVDGFAAPAEALLGGVEGEGFKFVRG